MNTQTNKNSLVWFITGTSNGFGLELVREALSRGDSVIATSRTPQKVAEAFAGHKDRLLAVPMDLGSSDQIAQAVQAGISRFGKLDVLVNNAGYGFIGAVEEATDDEIMRVHETNVFGLLRVLRAVLPHFRERGRGHIVNLSSISGLIGLPGFGIYNATKFAVEGISEALAAETAPLGIHVTIVEPGPFRTGFLSGSLAMAENKIPQYEKTAGATRAAASARNGKQPGDPSRAARAIINAVIGELAAKTLQQEWHGNRTLELEGPEKYSPADAVAAFSALLRSPVTGRPVPRSEWHRLFVQQGTAEDRTAPRIEMLDGFNSGWIAFAGAGAEHVKGKTTLKEILRTLIANNHPH